MTIRTLSMAGVVLLVVMLGFALRPVRDWWRGYFEVTNCNVGQRDGDGVFTLPLTKDFYRVYPQERRAIYWSSNFGTPSELINCVVRDRCNWQCEYPDHSGTISIEDCMVSNREVGHSWEIRSISCFTWWKYNYLQ